jgi:carboxypeptidase Taq
MPAMGFAETFETLRSACREIHQLRTASDLLGWDREVMMPPGGIEARSEVLELLARLEHERLQAPAFADALAAAEGQSGALAPDDVARADLRELRRQVDRAQRVPAALAGALARTQSLAQHAWEEARAAADFGRFRPHLDALLRLVRDRAACLGHAADGEAWDALVDDFEPGATARSLAALLDPLAARQAALVGDLLDTGVAPDPAFRRLRIPVAAQAALCRALAERLGFDFARGRLDLAVHPFTSGTHPGDVRLTTRYDEADLFDGLYSTIHEVGHGLYEQGLPAGRAGLPSGAAASLGMHESQSRFYENHVGRSSGFWRAIFPTVRAVCGEALGGAGPDEAYRAANRVARSLIRVDADEATYDLHIAIRFAIERELVGGRLEVADLPQRWNAAYRELLGVEVPDDRRGCLQDVHWAAGLFGYFPTYTLGNLYAAELASAAAAELGALDPLLAAGRFADLLAWLREKVHRHGARTSAAERIEAITGRPPSIEPFLEHLAARLGPLHGRRSPR